MESSIEPKSKLELKDVLFGKGETDGEDLARVKSGGLVYSKWRKVIIVFTISWMALTMSFSSTAIFSATNEIASNFNTSRGIIDILNAVVFVVTGATSFFWVPVSQFIGRKNSYDIAVFFLFAATIGTACSQNLAGFFATRLLAGCAGTYLLVAGQTTLTDIFEPTRRGMATSFLMIGSLFGPALGPCLGGVVVTFSSWRVIFWIQAGMAGLGLLTSVLFVPSIPQSDGKYGKTPFSFKNLALLNPLPALSVLKYPNILLTTFSCAFLSWLQYCLLVSPRHLINPRFHLETPLISGLFYLAPGFGFIFGAILGGTLSDRAVIRGIKSRNGLRLPQDRLETGLWAFFGIIPVATLVYGWTMQFRIGGLAITIVSAFSCGLGLMFAFTGINAYCAEAYPKHRTEVIMTKYLIQYIAGAASTASIIPLIDMIGIGWTCVVSVILVLVAGTFILMVTRWGSTMQDWTNEHIAGKVEA